MSHAGNKYIDLTLTETSPPSNSNEDRVSANDNPEGRYHPDYGVDFPVIRGAIPAANTLNVNGYISTDPTSSVFTNSTVESFIPCYDATTNSSPGGANAALNASPVQNITATVNIARTWMLALYGTTL